MSYVEQITHYDNRTSKWHVSHWKVKWEGDSKAIITWTKVDMMQERPVPEWSWAVSYTHLTLPTKRIV